MDSPLGYQFPNPDSLGEFMLLLYHMSQFLGIELMTDEDPYLAYDLHAGLRIPNHLILARVLPVVLFDVPGVLRVDHDRQGQSQRFAFGPSVQRSR